MPETMAARIEALRGMDVRNLQERYKETFGCREAPTTNREFLWKRIAYRIQEELGGLGETALAKLAEVQSTLGEHPLARATGTADKGPMPRNRRIPAPGTVIRRPYKGQTVEVKVLEDGYEYQGRVFGSLSSVARAVTGSHWNGLLFFNL